MKICLVIVSLLLAIVKSFGQLSDAIAITNPTNTLMSITTDVGNEQPSDILLIFED